jgi:asparagine synthetase B (glutamine-hydrolysing)
MAWGLEARVPFLDKAFLEVAMNVDPREKMFSKGSGQQVDEDGRPRMEKVVEQSVLSRSLMTLASTSSAKRSMSPSTAR